MKSGYVALIGGLTVSGFSALVMFLKRPASQSAIEFLPHLNASTGITASTAVSNVTSTSRALTSVSHVGESNAQDLLKMFLMGYILTYTATVAYRRHRKAKEESRRSRHSSPYGATDISISPHFSPASSSSLVSSRPARKEPARKEVLASVKKPAAHLDLPATLPSEIPDEFLCPISRELMKDPVQVGDGRSYERSEIQRWYDEGKRTCPMNQKAVLINPATLATNSLVRVLISHYLHEKEKYQGPAEPSA